MKGTFVSPIHASTTFLPTSGSTYNYHLRIRPESISKHSLVALLLCFETGLSDVSVRLSLIT